MLLCACVCACVRWCSERRERQLGKQRNQRKQEGKRGRDTWARNHVRNRSSRNSSLLVSFSPFVTAIVLQQLCRSPLTLMRVSRSRLAACKEGNQLVTSTQGEAVDSRLIALVSETDIKACMQPEENSSSSRRVGRKGCRLSSNGPTDRGEAAKGEHVCRGRNKKQMRKSMRQQANRKQKSIRKGKNKCSNGSRHAVSGVPVMCVCLSV